jgi:hypothetical protein
MLYLGQLLVVKAYPIVRCFVNYHYNLQFATKANWLHDLLPLTFKLFVLAQSFSPLYRQIYKPPSKEGPFKISKGVEGISYSISFWRALRA